MNTTLPGESRTTGKRFAPKQGLIITLCKNPPGTNGGNANAIQGVPLNISKGGAYVRTDAPVKPDLFDTARIEIPNMGYKLERPCKLHIGRQEQNGNSCALTFLHPLSSEEETTICSKNPLIRSLDLVKSDFEVINREIEYARQTRMKVFLTILSCLSTWIIGTVALGLTNHLQKPLWLAIGASLPAILLVVGIFSNVMCVNFLNLRKAYLAILSFYYRNEILPPGYLGWSHYSVNRHSCKNRIKQGLCDKAVYCYKIQSNQTTQFSFFSDIIESIGKIIGIVYSILFATAVIILIWITLHYFNNAAMAYATGAVSILIFGYLLFITYSLAQGSRSIESYYMQWKSALIHCDPLFPEETADEKN